MTRRYFLRASGAAAAWCALAPADRLLGAAPAPVRSGRTLVAIFLRGGLDGLNLIVPYGDRGYARLRRTLALPRPRAEGGVGDLDGFFGLHPRAAALDTLFRDGRAVALHAVGHEANTRSHFEEQDVWETGRSGETMRADGWLNRHLRSSEGHGPVRAVAMGSALPRILQGPAPAYSLQDLRDLTRPLAAREDAVSDAIARSYAAAAGGKAGEARELLAQTGQDTLRVLRELRAFARSAYTTEAAYPNSGLGRGLRDVARLIKADVGLEVAELSYGGWDTHNGQAEPFGNLVEGLAAAVAAFAGDMADRLDEVLVLTLSDFGRTAAENGSAGTDHGWGNCMLAVGGARAAGPDAARRPVLGRWPGLLPDQLRDGRDLGHTTDFRDVLAEAVRDHLGNDRLDVVLPGHRVRAVGLTGPAAGG